jgi:hypothetical protein
MTEDKFQKAAREEEQKRAQAAADARLDRFARLVFEFVNLYAATGSREWQLLIRPAAALASWWRDTNGNKLANSEAAAEAKVNAAALDVVKLAKGTK